MADSSVTGDPRIHVTLDQLRGLERESRGLSFLPGQPSGSVLHGRQASRLRGRGFDFKEMRGYQPGDDVRAIDWRATARTGVPHVRVFAEERDRPALLVVDQRMSMFFGTRLNMKSVTAAEASAIAAYQILAAGDRVGGIVFDDERQLEVVPKRSNHALYTLLEGVTEMNQGLYAGRIAETEPGSLNRVLGSIARIANHDHLILVFSDFDGIDETTHRRLSGIARHNDLILMLVHDPVALSLVDDLPRNAHPAIIGDGRQQAEVNFASKSLREALGRFSRERLEYIQTWQQEINLSVLPLSAGEPTLPQLRYLLGSVKA